MEFATKDLRRSSEKQLSLINDQLMRFLGFSHSTDRPKPTSAENVHPPGESKPGKIKVVPQMIPGSPWLPFRNRQLFLELQNRITNIFALFVNVKKYQETLKDQAEKMFGLLQSGTAVAAAVESIRAEMPAAFPDQPKVSMGRGTEFSLVPDFTWERAGSISLRVKAAPFEAILLQLMLLIFFEHAQERITECPNAADPRCKGIFFRIGKSRYCSKRCTRNMTMKNWRKSAGNRRAESKRYYQKKKAIQMYAEHASFREISEALKLSVSRVKEILKSNQHRNTTVLAKKKQER